MFVTLCVCASNQNGSFWDSFSSTVLQYTPTILCMIMYTPSGPKYLQHFAQHNFFSRANLKTGKNHTGPFCIVLGYFPHIQ